METKGFPIKNASQRSAQFKFIDATFRRETGLTLDWEGLGVNHCWHVGTCQSAAELL
jgi:hypothetical protein